MHYVSDTTRYANIVFIGFQLVLAYIERLMSTVNVKYQCQCKLIPFSHFGVEVGEIGSVNYATYFWQVQKLKQYLLLRAFSVVVYESSIPTK